MIVLDKSIAVNNIFLSHAIIVFNVSHQLLYFYPLICMRILENRIQKC